MKMFVDTLAKKLMTASGVYGNSIDIPIVRKNQFHVLKSLKLEKMVSFGNFAASLPVFILVHCRVTFFHQGF